MCLWVCQMMLLCFMRGMNAILIQKDIFMKIGDREFKVEALGAISIIKTIQHLLRCVRTTKRAHHICGVLYYSEIYAGIGIIREKRRMLFMYQDGENFSTFIRRKFVVKLFGIWLFNDFWVVHGYEPRKGDVVRIEKNITLRSERFVCGNTYFGETTD